MATKIQLPDLRFESSFRRSLTAKAHSSSVANNSQDPDAPIPITPLVVLQVVMKDVVIMPLLQGVAWSLILLLAKPWLALAAQHGRRVGVNLYHSLGFNVKKMAF